MVHIVLSIPYTIYVYNNILLPSNGGFPMKKLKSYIIAGIIFVLTAGTLSHFLYGWTGNNFIIGFFAPVSESVWEHMKLVFFPMLFYSLFAVIKLKGDYPCVASSLCFGILAGTWLIPLLFYLYTYLLGKNILILDIGTFALSTAAAFFIAYKLTLSCRLQPYALWLYCAVGVLLICFVLFTYRSPIPHS